MNVFEKIKERGYVYQVTDEKRLKELLDNGPQTFYIGIDPTADSLHIGHFFALTLVRRLQKMGHRPIVIIGGATALIGDPTGKKDMRKTLTKEQVEHNKKEVKELVRRFVDVEGENAALILDNYDWINKESYINFMRNIGAHFNVNTMLNTECYRNRLSQGGLTFLEMGYMLMQAYDFVYLNRNHDCILQVGGADQWANIVAGIDLSRKLANYNDEKKDSLLGLTCPLLVKADGEKMGKTASGTLWISREKTTVYDFYQMFINSDDADVERLLAFFSDYGMDEIKKMCNENIVEAKKVMAYEITKLVHGEEEAIKIKKASEEIFANKGTVSEMPTVEMDEKIIESGINVLDLLKNSGIVPSKSEGKRLVEQNGISINREKVKDVDLIINNEFVNENSIVLQKGKKTFLKIDLI